MWQQSEFPEELGPVEETPREIHFSKYWAVIVKHRWLIGLSIGVALAVAALYSILSKPTYRTVVVLEVERERRSPLDISSTEQAYGGYDPEFLPTQMRLMRSREIAERVVKHLNLVPDRGFQAKRSGFLGPEKKGGPVPSAEDLITRVALRIQSNTEVIPIKGTNLIELFYVSSSPQRAADIANAIAGAYIEWNLEAKFRVVEQTSQFLNVQIEQLKKELDSREQQLLAYGRQKDIISVDPQTNVTLQKLESVNRDYAAAVGERVAKEARYYEVRTARPEAVADTFSSSSGLVSQLRNEQARLERDYAEKLNLFKPEWPAMQQLKAQIDKGRQHLDAVIQDTVAKAREAAKSDYLTALRREESLKGLLRSQKSDAMTRESDAVEYNNLRVEIQAKKALLDNLMKRQGEAEMISRLSGERVSNVRVVDRALPSRSRFAPSYQMNGLLGLFCGSFVGIGLAFSLSYLDRSLRTAEEVEEYLQLPALGIIPAVGTAVSKGRSYVYGPKLHRKKKREGSQEEQASIELLPHQHPRSRVAERYRAFRTALLLSRAGGVKSIVITSSLSREGKTVTALNLAVVLSQLGRRVLLVDADLHRPHLHEVFRVSNRTGLVSILAENLEPARAIAKTDVPGVSVVPSGPSSPNPSGLLSSETMTEFLEFARLDFDYVILDAPPVVHVADALVLGHQTDGVVLCVKGGETPREHVARVRDRLLRSNVRILGVLINNLVEEAGEYGQPYGFDDYYSGKSGYGEEQRAASAARTI